MKSAVEPDRHCACSRRACPQLESLTGLDLSSSKILSNQARDFPSRVVFECANALNWIPAHSQTHTIFLTIDGVFEYFSEAELKTLFSAIAKRAPAMIALIEPIPVDYDFDQEQASRPYNEERSLGHHYPSLLSAAGFTVTWQTEVVDDLRWCLITAVKPA